MTDAEIIKALECCLVDNNDMAFAIECHGCAFDFDGDGVYCENCSNGIAEAAISVINHQKMEIERLQKHNSCAARKHYNDRVKDFAEKLKRECNGIISNDWNHKAQPVSWAAAYEEFIEDIDRLLNETVGE